MNILYTTKFCKDMMLAVPILQYICIIQYIILNIPKTKELVYNTDYQATVVHMLIMLHMIKC